MTEQRGRAESAHLDVAGGVAAGVCAVHCLLTPLLIAFGGLGVAASLISERMEVVFVATSLVIGLTSLGPAFVRVHHDPTPLVLFAAGLVALLLTRVLDAPDALERVIVPLCAVLLITSHARNHHACRRCHECESRDEA
jgi:hypothetical protein